MRSVHRVSYGFTVVELLTVCAVVVLGLALATPAMLKAREDARRQTCQNNLSQIGLALSQYTDTYNCFPPGWVLRDDAPRSGPSFAWSARILAQLGNPELFLALAYVSDVPSLQRHPQLTKRFEGFRCPADTTADAHPDRGNFGTSNYAGNYGVDPLPGDKPAARLGAHGIFHWNGCVRVPFGDNQGGIPDGLSNTFLVGERGNETGAGIWAAVRSNANADDAVATCNHANRINTSRGSFSSKHEGGANFLYCDGAVRFVSKDIDSSEKLDPPQGLFQKLASRDDGQPVNLDESTKGFLAAPKEVQDSIRRWTEPAPVEKKPAPKSTPPRKRRR